MESGGPGTSYRNAASGMSKMAAFGPMTLRLTSSSAKC